MGSGGHPISDSTILELMPQLCPKVRILRLDYDDYSELSHKVVRNLLARYADQLEELCINKHIRFRCGAGGFSRRTQRSEEEPTVN